MATIKAYTDIEQSCKLAKILPIESVDMWYNIAFGDERYNRFPSYHSVSEYDIPAWSLAALLKIIKDYTLKTVGDGRCPNGILTSEYYDEPIDACVDLIIKLKERNLL